MMWIIISGIVGFVTGCWALLAWQIMWPESRAVDHGQVMDSHGVKEVNRDGC